MAASAATDARPDVHQMTVVHRVFRRELASIPDLVRRTPEGDVERANVVGGHAELVLTTLHIHHTGEDELLWPLLLERAAPDAELIRTMERQHARVEILVDRVRSALTRWLLKPAAANGVTLAGLVDQLRADLVEHLDLEERAILPVVERHLSVAEWQALGEHGKNSTPRKHLPLVFGAILEEADEDERTSMLAAVPAPVRFFLRTVGERQYRRYITRVRGC